MTLEDFRERYKYDLNKDRLGTGGFSKVYKAYDTLMKRYVALKFYYGDLGEKYDVLAELKRVTKFNQKNLIRYYDATVLSTTMDSIYSMGDSVQVGVMEYANAGDLNDFLKSYPSLTSINKVVKGILEGLAYLHQRGIIHRDIKPQNILMHKVDGEWLPKIADFGLAKRLTNESGNSSKLLGTMEYMAPEQFDTKKYGIGQGLATNVDLWSFGIILYEIFTGSLPFGGRTEGIAHEQVMFNIMRQELPDDIEIVEEPHKTVIQRCLIKQAGQRARFAKELIDILEGRTANADYTASTTDTHTDTSNQTKTTKEVDELTTAQRRFIIIGNILLSPLLGILLFFYWKNSFPNKANQTGNIAWWSLAGWLTVLLLIVVGMILWEYNLLDTSSPKIK